MWHHEIDFPILFLLSYSWPYEVENKGIHVNFPGHSAGTWRKSLLGPLSCTFSLPVMQVGGFSDYESVPDTQELACHRQPSNHKNRLSYTLHPPTTARVPGLFLDTGLQV